MTTKTITQCTFFWGLLFFTNILTAQTLVETKNYTNNITSPSTNNTELYRENTSSCSTEDVLWQECFDGDFEGWTLNPVLGSFMWEFSPDGDLTNGVFAHESESILSSPSNDNGCMALNYDFLRTGGNPDNVATIPVITELISPIIDLSEVTQPVALEFHQLIRYLHFAPGHFFSSFSISRDGGNTWDAPINANPNLVPNENENNRMYFPLLNVAGEENLRLKFTYAGDFFYWALDDIALIKRPPNDMRANENFFAIPNNLITPFSQIEPIYFLSDIENVGANPQTGVELSVKIKNPQGIEVFSSVEEYETIGLDSLAENVIFSETYTPTRRGHYQGLYEVSSDSLDHQLYNNTISFSFNASDTIFSKEIGDTGEGIHPDEPNYTYGNIFYVPNGEGWHASSISFQYRNPEELAIARKEITTKLYKWDGNGVDNFTVNIENNMELLSFNSYVFQGDETGLITIPVDVDGRTFELESGHYYVVAVEYTTEDTQTAVFAVNRNYNYAANYFLQDSLEIPRYISALDAGNTGTFDLVGFGLNVVPVVRLNIRPGTSSNNETLAQENIIKLSPNPTSESIQLVLDLTERFDDIIIKIFDIQGRQMMQQTYKNVQKQTFSYPIKALAAGTYFLHLVTDKGTRTKRFIVK